MRAAHEALKSPARRPSRQATGESTPSARGNGGDGVPADALRELTEGRPGAGGLHGQHKAREDARAAAEALDSGGIDWGHAESLAFASLLVEGIPIRLTGQDTERGTFSHRHLVLHDAETGAQHAPISTCPTQRVLRGLQLALSEYAALGFEYGYSVTAPEALVLWEAQFGDFINGAQIIVDQFLVRRHRKWRQDLPADASPAARLRGERAGALERAPRTLPPARRAGEHPDRQRDDLRAVLPPSPPAGARPERAAARRDAAEGAPAPEGGLRPPLRPRRRPLRAGARRPVAQFERVTKLAITSGKLYYDISGHELRSKARTWRSPASSSCIPSRSRRWRALVASYPALEEVVWAQEEPQNMGAWRPIGTGSRRPSPGSPLGYAGRPWRASPSEGYPTSHARA